MTAAPRGGRRPWVGGPRVGGPQGGWVQGKFQSPGPRASSKASPKARDEEEETGTKGIKGRIVISDA